MSLSPRKREILRLIADGMTNKQIGDRLKVSVRTVDSHIRTIAKQSGAKSRSNAVWIHRGEL